MSIFFESLPFLLLGSLISAIIETFVSNERMAKLIPKNKFLGSIVGVFLGFFLPACDCAVIPVSKRLLKKKVPINVAVVALQNNMENTTDDNFRICGTGDVIEVRENKKDNSTIKANVEANAVRPVPAWLEKDNEKLSGKVLRLASREDIDIALEEHLIVELYSK